ncbi:putative RNA-directed DNA polymerase [Helianthus anomalus]
MLSFQKLTGYVDGTLSSPPETTTANEKSVPNPDFETWKDTDQKVLWLIQSSLSEEAMNEVIGLSTARQVWLAFENAYSHCSLERMHTLRDTLRQLQKGSSTVSEFGQKFKLLCDQLAAIGHPVDENDKCHWFLCGLGSAFETFSTAHYALPTPTVFRDLLSKAENHELFLQTIHVATTTQAAFIVQQSCSANHSRNYHGTNRGRGRGS